MSSVFPLQGLKRQPIRMPPNPMDKSTVVSIYPRKIREVKHTLNPGIFVLESGSYEKPSLLVVGTSSWWKEIDPQQPLLEIPTPSTVVADSIVRDFANGLFQCDMGGKMVGLFYIPGNISREELHEKHQALLDDARAKQKNWFRALVEAGDALWSQSGGNPRSISGDMKLAAEDLGLTDKPWLKDFESQRMDKCPACGQLRDANYPICQHCQTIVNPEQYRALGFAKKVDVPAPPEIVHPVPVDPIAESIKTKMEAQVE